MIFIGGVHGVGKSYFCNIIKERLGIKSYSASRLIEERRQKNFPCDKLIEGIDDNQKYLLLSIAELRTVEQEFILDGHFCLLNKDGLVTRIGVNTFTNLRPDAIILLTENPDIIATRRKIRDGIIHHVDEIRSFQDEEVAYAIEISELLKVPIYISKSNEDFEVAIQFIISRRICNGR